ncbi:DUF2231 domain-containing protein [Caenispirillum bisanense]|uniref:DUF2231 domain-containing protein n=1 Tax=Caenispirillum bisanense TaxID=414052 RepID=UPI0031CF1AE8
MPDLSKPMEPPDLQPIASKIAIAGHPLHAMLVTFPIALVAATLGCDAFYWWTGDPFFARASVWTSGWGFVLGIAAGAVGTLELLAVRGIRHRGESWSHAVAAMLMLAVIGANWGLRLAGGESVIFPWGLFLSGLGFVAVGIAGWHGGKLVFEHQIGIMVAEDGDEEDAAVDEDDAAAAAASGGGSGGAASDRV